MAVDTQTFITELSQYGTVEFCDINNPISYVVIIIDYTSDEATFLDLVNLYLVHDYPYLADLTIVDNVLKADYSSVEL